MMVKLYYITFTEIDGWSQEISRGRFVIDADFLTALKSLNKDNTSYVNSLQEETIKEIFNVFCSYYDYKPTTKKNHDKIYTKEDFINGYDKVQNEKARELMLREKFNKEYGIDPNNKFYNPIYSIVMELKFSIWRSINEIVESYDTEGVEEK